VHRLLVLVLGQQLLDGVAEELRVAFGVVQTGVGQVLVVGGQVAQLDVDGDLLAVGDVPQLL